jgi:GNAT superfamily N-acetyltransferase
VSRAEASEAVARKAADPVPAVLLGRMAVQVECQNRLYGARMLQHAIGKALAASELIGARCLLVHALDEHAQKFDVDRGFRPSPITPWTVMLPLKEAEHTLEIVGGT